MGGDCNVFCPPPAACAARRRAAFAAAPGGETGRKMTIFGKIRRFSRGAAQKSEHKILWWPEKAPAAPPRQGKAPKRGGKREKCVKKLTNLRFSQKISKILYEKIFVKPQDSVGLPLDLPTRCCYYNRQPPSRGRREEILCRPAGETAGRRAINDDTTRKTIPATDRKKRGNFS